MLEGVNAVHVSGEDLIRYADECRRLQLIVTDDVDPLSIQVLTAATHAAGNAEKAAALWCRMKALSRLIFDSPPQSESVPDPGLFPNAIFGAAATEAIHFGEDGHVEFEREAFLRRVFELTDAEDSQR